MLAFIKKSKEPFDCSFVKARIRNMKKSKNKTTSDLLCKIETLALIMLRLRRMRHKETMVGVLNPH